MQSAFLRILLTIGKNTLVMLVQRSRQEKWLWIG